MRFKNASALTKALCWWRSVRRVSSTSDIEADDCSIALLLLGNTVVDRRRDELQSVDDDDGDDDDGAIRID